jgi:hypothetical protein
MTRNAEPWNVGDVEGRLGRAVHSDSWWAPGRVEERGGLLSIALDGYPSPRFVSGDRQMLERFAALHEGSNEAIRLFAERWGLLHLCSHGIAQGHARIDAPMAFALWHFVEIPEGCYAIADEPLDWWRYWSQQAWGLLSAVSRLRLTDHPSAKAWDALLTPAPWVDGAEVRRNADVIDDWGSRLRGGYFPVTMERRVMADAATEWLHLAGVGLEVRWDAKSGRPDVAMKIDALLGGIAMQLALAIGDVDGWGICAGCGAFHVPQRPSASSRRSFCEACRTAKVPRKLASKAYRAKKRARREQEG